MKSKQNTKPRVTQLKNQDGTLTASDIESGNVLNNFFKSVFVQETTDNVPDMEVKGIKRQEVTMDEIEITADEVCKKL